MKVDKLVEWVAKQLEDVFSELNHWDCSEECGHKVGLTEWRDNLARQILSHPDLALKGERGFIYTAEALRRLE